jgi:hypothetical protein
MSSFEFVSVSVAIVLAITLGRLMSAVNDVFDRKRRDYLHIAFYLVSYVGILTVWWAQWMMSGIERWTFFGFALVMASPIAQYFTVHALLSANPSEVKDWRGHLNRGHRWYFSAMLALTTAVGARRFFLVEGTAELVLLMLGVNAAALVWAIVSKARLPQFVALVAWVITLGFAVVAQFAIEA